MVELREVIIPDEIEALYEFDREPSLGRPHADTLQGSTNLKELIIQHCGDPYRVIFVFDPRRTAILLLGGQKADKKWYKTAIPQAEKIYDQYLKELEEEGLT